MVLLRGYLAAPLFNDRERFFNVDLACRLAVFLDVFLPQRDGSLLVDMVAAGVPLAVAESRVYEQDRAALSAAHLLIAVLDGAHVDEGVAFELGFAVASGCVCVGLQTDVRRALPSGNNPMLGGSLTRIFADCDALIEWVAEYTADREALLNQCRA